MLQRLPTDHINKFYGYDLSLVLFKRTLAANGQFLNFMLDFGAVLFCRPQNLFFPRGQWLCDQVPQPRFAERTTGS